VTRYSERSSLGSHTAYPWLVVGLLWFCGFFNYADRQAVYSVFPLLKTEFGLSKPQLGMLASAFMLVYACASPFSGYSVDLLSRRLLITVGLTFWSLVCAATALSRNFVQLVIFRGAEGLGEAFYFPASMSFLADYHGPATRSRALSIHQTSVYIGTAGGAALAGSLAQQFGWRSPFWVLGLAGMAYALFLAYGLIEPKRPGRQTGSAPGVLTGDDDCNEPRSSSDPLIVKVSRILTNPPAALLLAVFVGANFVAATFLAWLPSYIFERFDLGVSDSSITSTFWPLASLPGAVCGGIAADRAARRWKGGRIRVQSLGLFLAAPFVFLTGWAPSVPLLIAGLIGAGICKGIYDSNIFASLFDVVEPADRGTAAGLMNSVGWTGGFVAPTVVGFASDRFGMGVTIAWTAAVYLLGGTLAMAAARLAETRRFPVTS
jgi:MFS family permease